MQELHQSKRQVEAQDIYVLGEIEGTEILAVTYELLTKARALASKVGYKVHLILVGQGIEDQFERMAWYGVDTIYQLHLSSDVKYQTDRIAGILAYHLKRLNPSVVLIGATQYGRSLGPRIAASLETGLTADCTGLDMSDEGDLIQTRPAYGGNIMAEILTKHHRPQMSTVRPHVFVAEPLDKKQRPNLQRLDEIKISSRISEIKIETIDHLDELASAKRIVVAGMGLDTKEGLALVEQLAKALNAQLAYTRPMIEKGIAHYTKQIGLSGRAISPELLVTCGVSGSIHFRSGIYGAKTIVAINSDPQAEIFEYADVAVRADAYTFIPKWIKELENA